MASKCVSDDETKALRPYKIATFKIFNSRFAKLNSSLQTTIEPFVNNAFEAGLINEQVKKEKNLNSVIDEFKAGFEWCKSVTEMKDRCRSFVEILEELGGSARMAGKDLHQELQKVFGMYIWDHYLYIYFMFYMYAI